MARSTFTIRDLSRVIARKANEDAADSYTATLLKKGPVHICKKLQEEVLEAALETHDQTRDRITNELADIVYHLLVLAESHGVTLAEIEGVLASRHRAAKGKKSRDEVDGRLVDFQVNEGCASSADLFAASGMGRFRSADVVLFSHVLAAPATRRASKAVFYQSAKELRARFQGGGLKAKLGIAEDSEERFVARRSVDEVLPLLFVANAVVLPLCLNVLAAYVKDACDRLARRKDARQDKQKVEIMLGVAGTSKRREQWYTFQGTLNEVLQQIESVVTEED